MGYNTNRIKERAEEFESQYHKAMTDELEEQIGTYLDGREAEYVSTEDIEEIVVNWKDALPEIGDWCFDKVQSELDDIGDMKYEESRDRD